MTLDSLFAEVTRKKLFLSNFYQGTDDQWRCWLRKRRNDIGKMHGIGATPEEALRAAIDWKAELPDPEPVATPRLQDQFEDLL